MSMMLRRHMMIPKAGGESLPSGYTRLKSVWKTADCKYQYINTGIKLGTKMFIKEFDYEVLSTSAGSTGIFGGRQQGSSFNRFGIWVNNSFQPALNCGGLDSGFITSIPDATGRHNITTTPVPSVSMDFDGVTVYSNTTQYDTQNPGLYNIFIMEFANSNATMNRECQMKLYGICFADDSGDLFRAVPAMRDIDSEVGLYDFVSQTFFTKADNTKGNFSYETF